MRKFLLFMGLFVPGIVQEVKAQVESYPDRWLWSIQGQINTGGTDHEEIAMDRYGNVHRLGAFNDWFIFTTLSDAKQKVLEGSGEHRDLYFIANSGLYLYHISSSEPIVRYSITTASDGHPVIAGTCSGTLNLPGMEPIHRTGQWSFVFKFDVSTKAGKVLWITQTPESTPEVKTYYEGIAADQSGNLYVSFSRQRSDKRSVGFLKLDANGSPGRDVEVEGAFKEGDVPIAVDKSGNLYLAAGINKQVTFGVYTVTPKWEDFNAALCKYNMATNRWVWAKNSYGLPSSNINLLLTIGAGGPVLVHSDIEQFTFDGALVSTTNVLANGNTNVSAVAADCCDNVYITGNESRTVDGITNLYGYVRKYNFDSKVVWEKFLPEKLNHTQSNTYSIGSGIAVLSYGDYISEVMVTGRIRGSGALGDGVTIGSTDEWTKHFEAHLKQAPFRVLAPAKDQVLRVGQDFTLQWDPDKGEVYLFYSTDDGNSWNYITHGTFPTGKYKWSVPQEVTSTKCRIRVSYSRFPDYYYGHIYGYEAYSNAFSIRPSLEITSPNSGVFREGAGITVRWIDTKPNGRYNIDYKIYDPVTGDITWDRMTSLDGNRATDLAGSASGLNEYSGKVPDYFNYCDPYLIHVHVSRMASLDRIELQDSSIIFVGDNTPCPVEELAKGSRNTEVGMRLNQDHATGVFPNPATNSVTVRMQGLGDNTIAQLHVYNTTGKEVLKKQAILNKGTLATTFDISELKAGVYFVKVHAGNESKSISFVKQ